MKTDPQIEAITEKNLLPRFSKQKSEFVVNSSMISFKGKKYCQIGLPSSKLVGTQSSEPICLRRSLSI